MTDEKTSDANEDNQADAPVIEAEIVEEVKREEPPKKSQAKAKVEASPATAQTPKSGSFFSRLGWYLALLFAAFIGGVVAEPYLHPTLERLGLRPEGSRQNAGNSLSSEQLESVQQSLSALDANQKALAQRLDALAAEPTGTAALPADLQDRMEALELALQSSTPAPGAIGDWSNLSSAQSEQAAALADLKNNLERMQADLVRVAGAEPQVPLRLTQELAALRAIIDRQQNAISGLEAGLVAASDRALNDSPRGRLVLELSAMREAALRGESVLTSLTDARAHMATISGPVAEQLALVFDSLEAALDPAPPSYVNLVERFDAVASEALAARDAAEEKFLAGLFISRDTSAGATGLDAVLNQAERRLMARDVTGAAEALLDAEGAAADALRPWRSEAERLTTVLASIDQAVRLLSGGRSQ